MDHSPFLFPNSNISCSLSARSDARKQTTEESNREGVCGESYGVRSVLGVRKVETHRFSEPICNGAAIVLPGGAFSQDLHFRGKREWKARGEGSLRRGDDRAGAAAGEFQETRSDSRESAHRRPVAASISNNEEGLKPGLGGILIPDRYRPRGQGQ